MSHTFDISYLPFEELGNIISECSVTDITFKKFYAPASLNSEKGSVLELPYTITIVDKNEATYAALKWNLRLVS